MYMCTSSRKVNRRGMNAVLIKSVIMFLGDFGFSLFMLVGNVMRLQLQIPVADEVQNEDGSSTNVM